MGKTSIHVYFNPNPLYRCCFKRPVSDVLQRYLSGAEHQGPATSAYHPQSNGKCERLNGLMGPSAST
ncbi:hypothetical protein BGZ88_006247, partial [Linnemannia elongata]